MKRIKSWTLITALVMVLALAFAGCSKSEETGNNETATPTQAAEATKAPTAEPTPETKQYTVCWYDGTTLLKEEKVDEGATPAVWTPEKTDATFMGWYADISLAVVYEAAPVNSDIDIFAGFRTDSFTEDTRDWYIVGSGMGTLKTNNWTEAGLPEWQMTKLDVEGANVYEYTADLYAGDQLQFKLADTWTNQHGIGYFTTYEKDGVAYFYEDGGFGDSNLGWNAYVAVNGTYKFTLTTFPDSPDYDTIEWEFLNPLEEMAETHRMYITGTMNEWPGEAAAFTDDTWLMAANDTKDVFTYLLSVDESMYADWTADENGNLYAAFKVINVMNGDWIGFDGENVLVTAGDYLVSYFTETNTITVEPCNFYVTGTFPDSPWTIPAEGSEKFAMTVNEDGTLSIALEITEADTESWIADQGKVDAAGNAANCAIKVVYGAPGAVVVWYGDNANGGDNWYISGTGIYNITASFDAEGNCIVDIAQ